MTPAEVDARLAAIEARQDRIDELIDEVRRRVKALGDEPSD